MSLAAKNLGDYLDDAVRKHGAAPMFQFYDRTITYQEFGTRVDTLANALRRQGFRPGDFIHVLVQNSPEVLACYFAIQKIGAIAGPVNGWWKGPEIQYLLNDSKGRGLIIEDQYLPLFTPIRARCPHLEIVIEVGDAPAKEHVSSTPCSATATPRR